MTIHKRTILDELTVTDPLDKKFTDEQMGQLGEAVNKMLDCQQLIQDAEENVKKLKKIERDVNQGEIPKLMEALGFESVTVDGKKISVKDSVQCAIPAPIRPEAYSWMDDNGHGDLIKALISIKFPREERVMAEQVNADLAESVHAGTLKAWAREELAQGHSLPAEFFKIHVVKITTVK